MALNIRNQETEQLVTELVKLTGETKTEAVRKAINTRLIQARRQKFSRCLADELDQIAKHCAALPVLNRHFSVDTLYDENGLPK